MQGSGPTLGRVMESIHDSVNRRSLLSGSQINAIEALVGAQDQIGRGGGGAGGDVAIGYV